MIFSDRLRILFPILRVLFELMNFYSRKPYVKQPPIGALKKRCSKKMQQFYRRHPCWSVISIKLLCNFIEVARWHECSPVNLSYTFRTPFPRSTSGWLLLHRAYDDFRGNKSSLIHLDLRNIGSEIRRRSLSTLNKKYWYSEAAVRRCVLKNLAIFTGKRLRWILFLIKLEAFRQAS